jgi:hypothetical protein
MNKQESSSQPMLHNGKHICNNMGQSVLTHPNSGELYAQGALSENHSHPKKPQYRMVMPYEIFMKNQYNM